MASKIFECALISQLHNREILAENAGNKVVSDTLLTKKSVYEFAKKYDVTYFKRFNTENGFIEYHVIGINNKNKA